ncbi:nucleotidyl transferase AbiEii/AbiGii toxin family protein [Mesorhizobium sp. M6A.T.Cr.TU.017.01.1.1]|uniref:nucleotidyl transferase AbiEii/AbiGii toxin family protein n=1 Tax=Mesorhizobium sp. M6A.T.Cr.TU.017.01.1.1 TaxID=2496774 RepID=UPI0013E2FF7D|nr:nucleotidyl transferase AbiEii/AbiGii toxin family protein [Mesorhizobium sp. M6A.T.Cr.TU.017.01.1.1]
MIDDDEIDSQAEQMGVHVANVERDYVFGWLLKCFFENAYLGRLLIFKGGNCMRKAYYPHIRYSGDLDFSVQATIDPQRFQDEINSACRVAQEVSGVSFDLGRTSFKPDRMIDEQRQSFKGRIYFQDFYGEASEISISVRLDVTEYDRVYLPTVTRPLIHPYSDRSDCVIELRCMSLEELIANKLKCLIQRRHSFDLYDLVYAAFFDRSVEINRTQVLRTFLQKTIFEPSPGAAKGILLGLPMAFFRAAWSKYISPLKGRIDFDQAAEGFKVAIEDIFGSVADEHWGHEPFYPAELRNLILEAGAGKRIMRVVYDGRGRDIEPYALSYKRPQNKPASEYFYVWDLTGGAASGPGMKTFFHHKIQTLELTDRTFEPRFPIELSKAGEASHKDYFGNPFSAKPPRAMRPRKPTAMRIRGFGLAPSYTVECPYCQKRFKRSAPTIALNQHKDDNGYPCGGRTGYLV